MLVSLPLNSPHQQNASWCICELIMMKIQEQSTGRWTPVLRSSWFDFWQRGLFGSCWSLHIVCMELHQYYFESINTKMRISINSHVLTSPRWCVNDNWVNDLMFRKWTSRFRGVFMLILLAPEKKLNFMFSGQSFSSLLIMMIPMNIDSTICSGQTIGFVLKIGCSSSVNWS